MNLNGKTAIVTGGSGALGSVIVARLRSEGLKVAYSSRDEKEASGAGTSSETPGIPIKADVTVEADVVRLFDAATRSLGQVEILVNTVGGFLPKKPLTEVSLEEWNHTMDINLKSAFLCCREALRRMQGRPYGRIINISAMTGLYPSAGRAPYAISKAAVSILTEILGQENKGTGLTVNAIAPGIIDTRANRKSMPDEDYRRWVKPANIADIVCYLCSEAANDINGTTIKAFGGI